MKGSKKLREFEDKEAWVYLQIGHLFGRNGVRQEILSKSSKVSALWKAPKN